MDLTEERRSEEWLFEELLRRSHRRLISDRPLTRAQRRSLPHLPQRLQEFTQAWSVPENSAPDYPQRGVLPVLAAEGLDFLHPDITEACVCVGGQTDGQFRSRWLGRNPLRPVQFWSTTKIVPLLNVVAQVNRAFPQQSLENCRIQSPDGRWSLPFEQAAVNIVSYQGDALWQALRAKPWMPALLRRPSPNSNALSALLKRFETYAGLESWWQQITGNPELEFRGNYGRSPLLEWPELVDSRTQQVLLKAAPLMEKGDNHVSACDLTRLLSMLGWHGLLPAAARLPDVEWVGLAAVIRALGQDCARYVDEAIAVLQWQPRSLLVLSKDGYGASDERHTDELTYTALVWLTLPDAVPRTLAIALRAVRPNHGRPNSQHRMLDARMATAVTQILQTYLLPTRCC